MKLDLNKPFLQLDGTEFPDKPTLGKNLSNILVSGTKEDALKFYDWAVKLHKGEPIDVDKSDLKKIREFVENHETMIILMKAQVLNIIDSIK